MPARAPPMVRQLPPMTGLSGLRKSGDDGFEVLATAFFHSTIRCADTVTAVSTPPHLTVLSWDNMCFSTYANDADSFMLNVMRNDATPKEIMASLIKESITARAKRYALHVQDEVKKKLQPLTKLNPEIQTLEDKIAAIEGSIRKIASASAMAMGASAISGSRVTTTRCGHCKNVGHNATNCILKKQNELYQEQYKLQKLNEEKVKTVQFKSHWNDLNARLLEMTTKFDTTMKEQITKSVKSLTDASVSTAQKMSDALETLALFKHLEALTFIEIEDFSDLFVPPPMGSVDPRVAHEMKIKKTKEKIRFIDSVNVRCTPKKFYVPCKTFAIQDFSGQTLNDDRKLVIFKFNLIVNLRLGGQNFDIVVNVNLHDLTQRPHVAMSEMVDLVMDDRLKHRVVDLMCQAYPEPKLNAAALHALAQGTQLDPNANWDVVFYESGCSTLRIQAQQAQQSVHLWGQPELSFERHHVPVARRANLAAFDQNDLPPMEHVQLHSGFVPGRMSQTRRRRAVVRAKIVADADKAKAAIALKDVRASARFTQSLIGVKRKNKTRQLKAARQTTVMTPTAFCSTVEQIPQLHPLPPARANVFFMPPSQRYIQPPRNVSHCVQFLGPNIRGHIRPNYPHIASRPLDEADVSGTESVIDPADFQEGSFHYQRPLANVATLPRPLLKEIIRNFRRKSIKKKNESRGSERSSSDGSHTRKSHKRRPVSPAAAAPIIAVPVIAAPARSSTESLSSASLPARSSTESSTSST
jgi:hypothetical protein